MNHLKSLISVICITVFFSCGEKTEQLNTNPPINNATTNNTSITVEKPVLNNPVLMNGSSFGHYFQSLYKLGRYEDMIKFTFSQTIIETGKDKILEAYKNMEFAYSLELKSKTDNPDSTITLNYVSQQFATQKIVRMVVTIENDSVKLVTGDFVSFY